MKDAGIFGILQRVDAAVRKEDLRQILRGLGRDYEAFRPTLTSICAKLSEDLPE